MKKGTCKYFTDEHLFSHCKAGVRYRDVMNLLPQLVGGTSQLPCVKTEEPVATSAGFPLAMYTTRICCNKYEEPTEADIAADQAKRKADMKQVRKIFPLIDRLKTEYQGRDWSGIQVCPICQQQLFVQHFGVTGRTWGKCETQSCIAWLE